jgi:uncharacterized membrane protein
VSGRSLGWTEQQMQVTIGNLLRAGVLAAAVVVLIGGTVYLVRHGAAAPQYGAFRGEPADLRTVSGIVTDAISLRGRGIIQLGLLILLATPIGRVAFSVLAFALQRDSLYVVVTLMVLAVLIFSLAGGHL